MMSYKTIGVIVIVALVAVAVASRVPQVRKYIFAQ